VKQFLHLFILFTTCCLVVTTSHAAAPAINAAASAYTFSSTQDAQRFSTLTKEVRCVVCQFQNIAESNAPLAGSLREKIYQLIQQKKSDDDIKSFLVKRYGEVILLKPRFNPATMLLWLFPLLALLVFAFILRRVYVIK
jgi:cytochrome c-type biogenesis protein CcmH